MISSILIPTDFSPASWSATQFGLEISRLNSHAKLSFLHVYPVSSKHLKNGNRKATTAKMEVMKNRMNQLAHDLSEKTEDRIRNVVLAGNVEEVMMQFIKENEFDLVIVGINSNGQNNDIGSHTIKVIRESGVPVMIVPNKPENGATAS